MKKSFIVLFFVVLLVAGCGPLPIPAETNQAGGNRNVSSGAKQEFKECDQAIGYKVLVAALPKELSGYTASEPQGATLTFQDPSSQKISKYSSASVYFTKKDSEWATESIDVSIMDTCYIQFLSQAWFGFYEAEGTQGFMKKATINGYPGWHQYTKFDNSYSYSVLINERVIVSVKGKGGIPDNEVENVMKSIDFALIASAGKGGSQGEEQNSQSPAQNTVPDTLETRAYSNNEYGFKINPPKGWQMDASKQRGKVKVIFFSKPQTDLEHPDIYGGSIYISSGPTPPEYDFNDLVSAAKDMIGGENFKLTEDKTMSINGIPAKLIGGTSDQGPFQIRTLQLFVEKNGQLYIVTGVVFEKDWNRYKDLFEASLLTFNLN